MSIFTDATEYPRITGKGRAFLRRLLEDPMAPEFNYWCGDRLTETDSETVSAFARRMNHGPCDFMWLDDWVADVVNRVPFYRKRAKRVQAFEDIPTCSRHDLSAHLVEFVPDDVDLGPLIVHGSSGRTARPLAIPHHPAACASYLPIFDNLLRRHCKQEIEGGDGRLSIALVCNQRQTITCATIATWLGEAGFVKINLQGVWPSPEACAGYLDKYQPEVITGDPVAFNALAEQPLSHNPKALLSTAMALSPGLQRRLERRFNCPVIDYYSLMESGPVAARINEVYVPFTPDLFVEILDPDGRHVDPGQAGEVTLTGGRNPYLPLLRYRTGDYARYSPAADGAMGFTELEGRAPVVFRAVGGSLINNIDVTRALSDLPLAQFQLHQRVDGELIFSIDDFSQEELVRDALEPLFERTPIVFEFLRYTENGKLITYTTDMP